MRQRGGERAARAELKRCKYSSLTEFALIMKIANRGFVAFCATSLVAACAAPSPPLLDQMTMQCVNGYSVAFNNVPMLQSASSA
jgi:hypothetical protein